MGLWIAYYGSISKAIKISYLEWWFLLMQRNTITIMTVGAFIARIKMLLGIEIFRIFRAI